MHTHTQRSFEAGQFLDPVDDGSYISQMSWIDYVSVWCAVQRISGLAWMALNTFSYIATQLHACIKAIAFILLPVSQMLLST